MSKNLKFAGTGGVVVLILAVILGVKLLTAVNPMPGFTAVIHAGYTNGPAGEPLAVFIFTNASETPYLRRDRYWLQTPSLGRRDGRTFFQGDLAGGPRVLLPGKTEMLLVPAPETTEEWRIYMFAEPDDDSLAYRLREKMSAEADRRGWREFPEQFRNRFYGVEGKSIGATTNSMK